MNESKRQTRVEAAQRRRYEPPRIEESGRFEQLVLTCAHLPEGPRCGIIGMSP